MKFKTTIIFFVIFLVILAFVYFFETRGKSEEGEGEKALLHVARVVLGCFLRQHREQLGHRGQGRRADAGEGFGRQDA